MKTIKPIKYIFPFNVSSYDVCYQFRHKHVHLVYTWNFEDNVLYSNKCYGDNDGWMNIKTLKEAKQIIYNDYEQYVMRSE